MKTKLIRKGNSQGLRVPRTLLQQCRLEGPLEIDVQGNQLVVRAASRPRQGWDEAFRTMHHHENDRLVDAEVASPSQWDQDEWEW